MAAFFRGFLLFFFGAVLGAAGVLLFAPSFNVVVSRGAGSQPPLEFVSPVAPAPMVAKTPAAPSPAVPVAAVEAAKPAVVATPKPVPAPAPAPAPAVASADPAIDFKAISQHLILWPTTVTVKTTTTVPVLADGKKVQDLDLAAGTVLQVSKVLADGSLEARAKGAKFEIPSALTDFSVELGKRVADLVAKGTKFDSPFAASSPAPVPATPVPAPVAATPVVVAVVAKPLTLAQRVDLLYGIKPESETPPTPVAPAPTPPAATPVAAPTAAPTPAATSPAVPVAPVVEAAPAAAAPAADPKAVEKGKDLDRKMNQLFK